jgi:hypothetical protein
MTRSDCSLTVDGCPSRPSRLASWVLVGTFLGSLSLTGCPGTPPPGDGDGDGDVGDGDGDGDIVIPDRPTNPPDSAYDILSTPGGEALVDAYHAWFSTCFLFIGGDFFEQADETALVAWDVRTLLESSADNPNIVINEPAAVACAAELNDDVGECTLFNDPDASAASACNNVFAGTVALGDSCGAYGECAEGECQGITYPDDDGPAICGTCTLVPDEGTGQQGDPCDWDGDCEEGLHCPYRDGEQTCQPYAGLNETCYDDVSGDFTDCEEALYCDYGEGTCQAYRQLGEVCFDEDTFDFFDCAPELGCNTTTTLCEARGGLGDACVDVGCAEPYFCDYEADACVAGAGENASCLGIGCAEGLYCDYDNGDVCRTYPAAGESCDGIYECSGDAGCVYDDDVDAYTCRPVRGEQAWCDYDSDSATWCDPGWSATTAATAATTPTTRARPSATAARPSTAAAAPSPTTAWFAWASGAAPPASRRRSPPKVRPATATMVKPARPSAAASAPPTTASPPTKTTRAPAEPARRARPRARVATAATATARSASPARSPTTPTPAAAWRRSPTASPALRATTVSSARAAPSRTPNRAA